MSDPARPDERLLLNEYGRRCYDLGYESAFLKLTARDTALAALVAQWRKEGERADDAYPGEGWEPGHGYRVCADQLAAVLKAGV